MADQTPWPIVPGHYWVREGSHPHEMARVILSGKLTLYTISGHPATPATFPNVVWGARILDPAETGYLAALMASGRTIKARHVTARLVSDSARGWVLAERARVDEVCEIVSDEFAKAWFVEFGLDELGGDAFQALCEKHGVGEPRVATDHDPYQTEAMACIKDLVGVYGATTVSAWATAAGIEGRGEVLVCDDLSADSSSCTRPSSEPRCLGCPNDRLARVRFEDEPASTHETTRYTDETSTRFEIQTRDGDSTAFVSVGRDDDEIDERVAEVPIAKLREMVGSQGPDVLAMVRKLANGQTLLARDVEGIGQADLAIFENLERMLGSISALADSLAELRGEAIKVEDAEDTMIGRMFARLTKIDPEWMKAQEQS